MFTTAQKISLARLAFHGVMLFRGLVGLGSETEVVRKGFRWRLDLNEGIDFCIYFLGSFEPSTLKLYKSLIKAGDIVVDIGANIGAHTLPLAALVGKKGKVLAFEPTTFAFKKLNLNIQLNPQLGPLIEVFQLMLMSDDTQILKPEIFSSWPLNDQNELHEQHKGKLKSTMGASINSLDQVLLELGVNRVNFIKLDVDGHEYQVMRGCKRTLEKFRPLVLMELAPYLFDENPDEFEGLIECFSSLGYKLKEANSGRSLSSSASELRKLIALGASMNVIAYP